jgi:hypothetical protein
MRSAAYTGNSLPTLRNNLSVPPSNVKKSQITQRRVGMPYRRFATTSGPVLKGTEKQMIYWPLEIVPTGYSEMSVRNYHYMLRNIPEERRSHQIFHSKYSFLRPIFCPFDTAARGTSHHSFPTPATLLFQGTRSHLLCLL